MTKKTVKKVLPKPEQRSVTTETGEVFIIQKNVPIAMLLRSLGPHIRYPFKDMLAGESFEMKIGKTDMKKAVSRMSSACASYVRKNNNAAKFTVRRTGTDSVRVWRIK